MSIWDDLRVSTTLFIGMSSLFLEGFFLFFVIQCFKCFIIELFSLKFRFLF
jgi:hypothetical protein